MNYMDKLGIAVYTTAGGLVGINLALVTTLVIDCFYPHDGEATTMEKIILTGGIVGGAYVGRIGGIKLIKYYKKE